jgi:hypothetical protein
MSTLTPNTALYRRPSTSPAAPHGSRTPGLGPRQAARLQLGDDLLVEAGPVGTGRMVGEERGIAGLRGARDRGEGALFAKYRVRNRGFVPWVRRGGGF